MWEAPVNFAKPSMGIDFCYYKGGILNSNSSATGEFTSVGKKSPKS
jgi:hypothetical protein